jgi:hypothetical protein
LTPVVFSKNLSTTENILPITKKELRYPIRKINAIMITKPNPGR